MNFAFQTMLRRAVLGVLALLLAALLGTGWYAYRQGFTHKWRQFVVEEFRKRGVELSMRRLTLDPFRGIVAKEVRVFESRERRRTRAFIEEVRLVVNFTHLLQGKAFIDAVDLYDVDLDLPLDPRKPGSTRVEVRHLSGRLFLPPRQLHLNRLEADLYGIHVTASGHVINPGALLPKSGRTPAWPDWAPRLIKELKALKFDGAPPRLAVQFSGDLADLSSVFIEAELTAEKVRHKDYQFDNFHLNLSLRDSVIGLKQGTFTDRRGTLRVNGRYALDALHGTLQLHSDLDAQALLQTVPHFRELDETVFYEPPKIDLTLSGSFNGAAPFRLLGALEQGRFAYKSVIFEGLRTDFSWDGERWAAQDVRLTHADGEITGELLQLPEKLRARLTSTVPPQVFTPLLTGRVGNWLRQLELFRSAAHSPGSSEAIAASP